MKLFSIIFICIAIVLIAYNATKINFSNIFQGESKIAIITIIAALCGIMLVQILRLSKKIENQTKQ